MSSDLLTLLPSGLSSESTKFAGGKESREVPVTFPRAEESHGHMELD